MKKVILYIATSLDGYIADKQGDVNWIKGENDATEMQDTFSPFFEGIGTVIMGRRTYQQIVTELSPDRWPYPEVTTYVFSHKSEVDKENIKFTAEDPCAVINKLKRTNGKDIWICGGAEIIHQLMQEDLIDIFHITTIPVILGSGIDCLAKMRRRSSYYCARPCITTE